MYAIVEIAGQQFKVAKDQKVYVHRLQEAEGSKITFDKVMLIDNGDDILFRVFSKFIDFPKLFKIITGNFSLK